MSVSIQQPRLNLSQPLCLAAMLLVALAITALPGCGSQHGLGPPIAGPGRVDLPTTPASLPAAAALTADQVRAELEKAVGNMSDDPHAMLELAMFYRNTNDTTDAERELIACWNRFPRFGRAPYALGMLYLTQGRTPEAIAPLRAAAALSPQDALVQMNTGLAYLRNSQEKPAMDYARAAIRIDPQVPDSYMLLARLLDHHGTSSQALASLSTYLRYSPNPAPGDYLMGRIYARQADRNNAALWLKRAVEADPSKPEFWVALGRVYYELFNATNAQDGIHCYEKALELDPNTWDAHLYLGRTLADQRNWSEAATHFRAALRSTDDPGPIYYDLGQALIQSGNQDEGRKVLEVYNSYHEFTGGIGKLRAAVASMPRDRARRYELARFCIRYRQYDLAIEALQEAEHTLGTDETLMQLLAQATSDRAEALQAARATGNVGRADPTAQPGSMLPDAASLPLQGAPGNGR